MTAALIIILVLGVIIGNIMLLKHSAKFTTKNLKQDPIEKARELLKEREKQDKKGSDKPE